MKTFFVSQGIRQTPFLLSTSTQANPLFQPALSLPQRCGRSHQVQQVTIIIVIIILHATLSRSAPLRSPCSLRSQNSRQPRSPSLALVCELRQCNAKRRECREGCRESQPIAAALALAPFRQLTHQLLRWI